MTKEFSGKVMNASEKDVKAAMATMIKVKSEVSKAFFGHEEVVNSLLRALICNGHVLLEGIPGIAKTLVIKTLAQVSGCMFNRIQFTVDLLPTDIVGLTTYHPNKGFEVEKGPIFTNFLIADEINRSPPKTQSALIEAMQEGQVTIGKTTFKLPQPFFVMANQNPLESEGVYNLPEAQVDRFLFKIVFGYPQRVAEKKLMEQNTTFKKFEDIGLRSIVTAAKIKDLQMLVHKVYLDDKIKDYILDIVEKSREKSFKYGEFIDLGASPRASIGLFIASKAEALMNGRNYVIPKDVRKVIFDVLRHRIILTYNAQAENINSDKVIDEILKIVRTP